MPAQTLDTVEIQTTASPTASIIWLHGLGADGHDFVPIVRQLPLPATAAVRFVFPHAPHRAVTVNGGYVMRAWYDVLSRDFDRQEDSSGIRDSAARVEQLVEREQSRGIPADRILLAGFSQGGAMALHTGLRRGERLAGILALSTYLPLARLLPDDAAPANRDVPIFMAHGTLDPVIPIALGTQSRDWLIQHGYPVRWREYPMEHSVCLEEIQDLGVWLGDRIGK